MQVVLIILIVVLSIILLGVNFYLLVLYIHPEDKGLGNVIYTKILVIIGLTLAQAQALMVPLDVANRSALIANGALNMAAFWFFLYIIVLVFISFLIPYAIFFYQTDQEDGICCNLLKAFLYTLGALVITSLILFITWAVFRYVDLPYRQIALNLTDLQTNTGSIKLITPTYSDQTFSFQTSMAVYIIAILSFFGWIFLILFGGVGLFALPIDMINQFRHRPKPRRTAQMKQTKQKLTSAINNMIVQGQQLKKGQEQAQKNSQAGWFQKFKHSRQLNTKFTQFKARYYALSEQFKVFNLQLKFNDTNPIIPFLKLIVGIIFIITTLMWLLQIIFGNIAKGFLGRPLIPFFNQLFIYLEDKNAGFVSTGIFAYMCLYLVWCVQKGNIKFGIRIPCCCRFHPMKENETWMNSFLFNVILLLIASVGVIQLCVSSFPTYTRNTQIYMIFGVQINFMRFYNFFYKNGIFPIALLIWMGVTLIYLLVTCNRKPKYMRDIERIREEKQKVQD